MNKKGLIVISLLILAFAFYWYQYKPRQIKERCSADAHLDSRAISESNDDKRQAFIDAYYDDCLMRFGLK